MSHIHPKKFARIHREQTKDAVTVYEATPIKQPWSVEKICSEVGRTAMPMSKTKVNGCLRHLQKAGLIRECGDNNYQRIPVSMKAPAKKTLTLVNKLEPEPEPEQPMPKQDLLDKIGRISHTLRTLADEIDTVALDIEGEIEAAQGKSEKLATLQKLLKSIQDDD